MAGVTHGVGAAVLTEGARELVGDTLPPDQIESLEEMVVAVVALCDCPEELTVGRAGQRIVLDGAVR